LLGAYQRFPRSGGSDGLHLKGLQWAELVAVTLGQKEHFWGQGGIDEFAKFPVLSEEHRVESERPLGRKTGWAEAPGYLHDCSRVPVLEAVA
jgi:hypothetical protein